MAKGLAGYNSAGMVRAQLLQSLVFTEPLWPGLIFKKTFYTGWSQVRFQALSYTYHLHENL